MPAKIGIGKELFTEQVVNGLSVPELQEYWGCSKTTVMTRKKEWDLLGVSPNSKKRDNGDGTKICKSCQQVKPLSEFYSNGYYNGKLKFKSSCSSCERGIRRNTFYHKILEILKSLGIKYECSICGYAKNHSALVFHHHSAEKNFEISRAVTTSIELLTAEIQLCTLLCHNCHHELHNPDLTINKEFVS